MNSLYAFGLGVGTKNQAGDWLEVHFPAPRINPELTSLEPLLQAIGYDGGNQVIELSRAQCETLGRLDQPFVAGLAGSDKPVVAVLLATDTNPQSVPEAYLKLHLLSHRLAKPHQINLTGLFGVLRNLAWTNRGPVDLEDLAQLQWQCKLEGEWLTVRSVDKFPPMTDYVVPAGVRIADTARVRLGAYLGEGTTIMHEGFVNFNAGTLGTSMVEGRISAGVVVGEGSDLGGGCSTMGTLSGGGSIVISVGKECLIGANAGIGIPLGDRCIVEAGLYITAGTKVALLDAGSQVQGHVKARELAGKDDLLFRRNSVTGAVECKANRTAVELNEILHAHN